MKSTEKGMGYLAGGAIALGLAVLAITHESNSGLAWYAGGGLTVMAVILLGVAFQGHD